MLYYSMLIILRLHTKQATVWKHPTKFQLLSNVFKVQIVFIYFLSLLLLLLLLFKKQLGDYLQCA